MTLQIDQLNKLQVLWIVLCSTVGMVSLIRYQLTGTRSKAAVVVLLVATLGMAFPFVGVLVLVGHCLWLGIILFWITSYTDPPKPNSQYRRMVPAVGIGLLSLPFFMLPMWCWKMCVKPGRLQRWFESYLSSGGIRDLIVGGAIPFLATASVVYLYLSLRPQENGQENLKERLAGMWRKRRGTCIAGMLLLAFLGNWQFAGMLPLVDTTNGMSKVNVASARHFLVSRIGGVHHRYYTYSHRFPSVTSLVAFFGEEELLTLALRLGADAKGGEETYDSPILLACQSGNVECVKILIEAGAPVNVTKGWSPLHQAVFGLKERVVHFLVESGADVNMRDDNETTALQLAFMTGSVSIANYLIDHGGQVDLTLPSGEFVIHRIKGPNKDELLELLMAHGADLNAPDEKGNTLLISACASGDAKLISYLLGHGMDVNAPGSDGDTPLHAACQNNRPKITDVLIDNGADLHAIGRYGKQPIHLACMHDGPLAAILIAHGADVNALDDAFRTPLYMACIAEAVETARLLVEAGAEPNVRSVMPPCWAGRSYSLQDRVVPQGSSRDYLPLQVAAALGNLELVDLLLPRTEDVNHLDSRAETMLDLAPAWEENIVERLREYGAKTAEELERDITP